MNIIRIFSYTQNGKEIKIKCWLKLSDCNVNVTK